MAQRAQQSEALWNGLRDNNGVALNGGKVYTDEAGTSPAGANPKTAWDDHLKSNPLANPIILDTYGRANAFFDGRYKLTIYDSDDNLIDTVDNAGYAINSGPWVSIREYASLTAAVAAIGAVTKTRLLIDAATTLTANTTVTSNITLDIQDGFPIPLGNYNLTIAKPQDYGDHYVFNHSGTGTVIFSISTKVKPQWFGDGRGSTVLNAALAAITTSNHTLYMNTDLWTLDAAVTVPSTCGFTTEHGMVITLGAFALGINGPRSLPISQVFNENSSGVVNLGATYHTDSIPQWWGAVGDGSTDDSNAFDSAIAALPAIGGRVLLMTPTVSYKASGMIQPNLVYIEGVVPETRIIPAADENVFALDPTTNVVRAGWKNIVIDGSATKATYTSQSGIVIKPNSGFFHDTIALEKVRIIDCGDRGLHVEGGAAIDTFVQRLSLRDVDITGCANTGFMCRGFVLESTAHMFNVWKNAVDNVDAESNIVFQLNTLGPKRFNWTGGLVNAATHTSGNSVYLNGLTQANFTNVDYETAPTMVKLQGVNKNITFDGCNFGSLGTTNIFDLLGVDGFIVKNSTDAGTITNAFNFSGVGTNIAGVDFSDAGNDFSASTNQVVFPTVTQISSGVYDAAPINGVCIVEGEGPAADDLVTLNDADGATSRFIHGQKITLKSNSSARAITVKSTGNIVLNAASGDMVLANVNDHIVIEWDGNLGYFVEVSRSDNS